MAWKRLLWRRRPRLAEECNSSSLPTNDQAVGWRSRLTSACLALSIVCLGAVAGGALSIPAVVVTQQRDDLAIARGYRSPENLKTVCRVFGRTIFEARGQQHLFTNEIQRFRKAVLIAFALIGAGAGCYLVGMGTGAQSAAESIIAHND